jgi:hypothetical protein
MGVFARAPYGPLPVGMVTELEAVGVRSIAPAQRQWDATAMNPCCCFNRRAYSEAGVMRRLSAQIILCSSPICVLGIGSH